MPIEYDLDRNQQLVHTRCLGDTTFDEVMEHFSTLLADPELPGRLDVLLDLSGLTSVPESDQLRRVAAETGALASTVRWGALAIVAVSDLLYGMSRMFQAFSESHFRDSCVFRSHDEAESWLARRREIRLGA